MLKQEGVEGMEAGHEVGGVQGHRGLQRSGDAVQHTANREQAHSYTVFSDFLQQSGGGFRAMIAGKRCCYRGILSPLAGVHP